jgi:hypothetical protein
MMVVSGFPDSILTQCGNMDKALPQSFARLRGGDRILQIDLSFGRQIHDACEGWARRVRIERWSSADAGRRCQPLAY